MQPVYLSKTLAAASSNGLGSISTAVPSVITFNTSNLDTARRVVFTSTGDASSLTVTFTGKTETGTIVSEAVHGSTATGINATTTADFLSLTAVSISSNANIPFLIGTSSVGGSPWKIVDYYSPTNPAISAALIFSTSANGMTGSIEVTLDDPTNITSFTSRTVPFVFTSTSHVSVPASTNSFGVVNNDGNNLIPIAAYRLTVTSSATGAGTVFATVLQSGD